MTYVYHIYLPQQIFEKCVCECVRMPSENSEPTRWFSHMTPDEHSPDATALPMASSHHFTHPYQVSARLALVLPLQEHPLWYPRIGLVINIIFIASFCDHTNVFKSTRLGSFWSQARALRWARLIVSLIPLSASHPPTPPPSRFPALTTILPLAKSQLVWRRLCQALWSSSALAGQKHTSLLSHLVWEMSDI